MRILMNDVKMNLILYNLGNVPFINGTTFDNIELYLFLKEQNIPIELHFITTKIKKSHIINLINDRYDIDFEYINDIKIFKNTFHYIKTKYKNVIFCDKHSHKNIIDRINCNKKIILHDDPIKSTNNIKIFNEFEFNGQINYNMKFIFNRYKSINKSNTNTCLLHGINKGTISLNDFNTYIKPIIKNKTLLLTINSLNDFPYASQIENIQILKKHPSNFFELFDEYIYFKTDT